MKEVTREEYHAFIGDKNCVLGLVGNWPYTAEWKMRNSGTVIAKSTETDKDEHGQVIYPTMHKYFINNTY